MIKKNKRHFIHCSMMTRTIWKVEGNIEYLRIKIKIKMNSLLFSHLSFFLFFTLYTSLCLPFFFALSSFISPFKPFFILCLFFPSFSLQPSLFHFFHLFFFFLSSSLSSCYLSILLTHFFLFFATFSWYLPFLLP